MNGPQAKLKRIPIQSTNLAFVEHNPHAKTLLVGFKNGREYLYNGVEEAVVDKLLEAPSKGSFFYKNIKEEFKCKRIK